MSPRLAVLIPCYNEDATIGRVVADMRAALPHAVITVIDNNSSDRTAALAREAGAVVLHEALQGKGHAVRRGFADVEADVYVLVDGDGTYDAQAAPALVALLLEERLDMVSATRVTDAAAAYRRGHRFGNRVLTGLVGLIFGSRVSDMLSGYRVFSRRFVKSYPALAAGFETETEFTVHALELAMPIAELPTAYRERPEGSVSKLNTWRDGMRILRMILVLVKEERPLQLFSLVAAVLIVAGLGLGLPVVAQFMRTGLVPRLPTAVLALGLELLGSLAIASGLILDSVARGRREMKRLAYLSVPGPQPAREPPGP
ncbi:MAG: glycosyltransferase [Rhodospirillales bacterium]|nr:glycosyltransferase [Rhodospirillales bacterium]